MRSVLDFFTQLTLNMPQFYIGHVLEKIDDITYKIKLSRGELGGKSFDDFEVEAILLPLTIQTNRGVIVELKRGERVLLLYANKTYFIIGSLKKEEQKNFKRIDIVEFKDEIEKRSFVIKPNGGTEIAITDDDKFIIRTENQKLLLDPDENVVEIKTRRGVDVKIDDKNQQLTIKTNIFNFVFDDKNQKLQITTTNGQVFEIDVENDVLFLKSAQNYGIKVSGSNVEIRGQEVNFYNTPF